MSPDALPSYVIRGIASVGFDTNVGHDFIEDAEKRYEFYHRMEEKVAFDLDMFNRITEGGLS